MRVWGFGLRVLGLWGFGVGVWGYGCSLDGVGGRPGQARAGQGK